MTSDTLKEFVDQGMKSRSAATVKTYQNALMQFEEWLEGTGATLEEFARADVQQYIDYLVSKKKSAATINKVFNAIKAFCRWADKKEAVEDIRVVRPPSLLNQAPKALSKVEMHRLIREVDRSGNKRNYAIIMVLLNTGIRLHELVSLDRDDITLSDRKGSLIVRNGKGQKERTIPLNVETRRALYKYLEERTDQEEALFLSNRFQRISPRTIQHIVEQHGFNVHQLRHTFITGLVRAKEDVSTIQSLSGHSSADMILRYSQPTEEHKEQAVEILYKD